LVSSDISKTVEIGGNPRPGQRASGAMGTTQCLTTSDDFLGESEDTQPIDVVGGASELRPILRERRLSQHQKMRGHIDRVLLSGGRDLTMGQRPHSRLKIICSCVQGGLGGAAHFARCATWPHQKAHDSAEQTTQHNVEYADLGEPPGHWSHLGEQHRHRNVNIAWPAYAMAKPTTSIPATAAHVLTASTVPRDTKPMPANSAAP
jgi:hypothetical protein